MKFLAFFNKIVVTFDNTKLTILALVYIFLSLIIFWYLGKFSVNLLRTRVKKLWEYLGKSNYIIEILLRLFLVIGGLSIGFKLAGINISPIYYFSKLLFHPFIIIGSSQVSIISILVLIFIIWGSVFLSGYIRKILSSDIYPRAELDVGIKSIIDTFLKYFIIAIGVVIGLQINGINLSVFATLGGGLMVGIGFGLQNIANNFISGIVILLERPIKVGDYIEVGGIGGNVLSISARSTSVRTRENIIVIVPNSKFISENVVNWSHSDPRVRIKIQIGISYKSDPETTKKVLLNLADNHPAVIKSPPPNVRLKEYGDSSINMVLEVWIEDAIKKSEVESDINYQIYKEFAAHGIAIPFPQMDLHIKEAPRGIS